MCFAIVYVIDEYVRSSFGVFYQVTSGSLGVRTRYFSGWNMILLYSWELDIFIPFSKKKKCTKKNHIRRTHMKKNPHEEDHTRRKTHMKKNPH